MGGSSMMGGSMGGMGGSMGGMGGSMGGMGGSMGGMGGSMGGMGGMMGGSRIYELIYIIKEIEPDSWSEDTGNNGNRPTTSTSSTIDGEILGEGRIRQFGPTRLVVWQTAEVHEQIRELIEQMSDLSDNQVSIETRFIIVNEHFLEDVGMQTTINRIKIGGKFDDIISADQSSRLFTKPASSSVPGSIGSAVGITGAALDFGVTYGGALDDLAVTFLVQATSAHANARTLTAPKLTVISGESGNISVMNQRDYISDISVASSSSISTEGDNIVGGNSYIDPEISSIDSGIQMMITPTITMDKKYVILSINTSLSDVRFNTGLADTTVAFVDGEPIRMSFDLPEEESTSLQTRIIVPDKGTILLGGLTLSALQEKEMGVPVLSKIPILGRLFSNRSEVKDKQILLVLVKPTIILKDEAEADAVAAISEEVPRY